MTAEVAPFCFVCGFSTWTGWQLQHGGTLPFTQLSQQDDPAIGKLEGIVMDIALPLVDLPKAGHFVRDLTFRSPEPVGLVLHFLLEGEFSAREQAHGDISIFDRREASRKALEFRGYERLRNLGRSGRNEM
jgi:hypothetical protein